MLRVAIALTILFASVSPSVAETTQPSPISQLMVLEPGDASWKQFHGAIWIEADKAQWNYRWGGLQCKGRELSDASVQLLFAAFRAEYQVSVEYVVSTYQNKVYRCLTGFTISRT